MMVKIFRRKLNMNILSRILLFSVMAFLMIVFVGHNTNDDNSNNNNESSSTKTEANAQEEQTGEETGKELKVALSAQPAHLDTQMTTNQVIREVSRNIYETLVTLDEEYK